MVVFNSHLQKKLYKTMSNKKSVIILILFFLFTADVFAQRLPLGRIRDMIPGKDSGTPEKPAPPPAAPPVPVPAPARPVPIAELATVYPGAVPVDPYYRDSYGPQYGSFYTDDSHNAVRAYYVREAGNPQIDRYGEEIFIYKDRRADADRVSISNKGDNIPEGIRSALKELKDISDRGLLSESEYKKIEEKYNQVTGFWKTRFSKEIFERYNTKLDPRSAGEEKGQEGQRLAMSGRRDEGIKLMQEAQEELKAAIELYQSPKIVDEWIKCLDEISEEARKKENYWNTMITIYSTGKG